MDVGSRNAPFNAGPDTSGGFRFGIQGLLPDYRNVLVLPKQWVDAPIRGDGRVTLDGETSKDAVSVDQAITLELRVENGEAELRATAGGRTALVKRPLAASRLDGNIALLATARAEVGRPPEWRFQD